MLQRFKFALLVPVACLLSTVVESPANAGLVVDVSTTTTLRTDGVYDYRYTVANSPTSTVGVAEFDLNTSTIANLGSIVGPTGFLALYTPGDSFIQFLSTVSSTGSNSDIAPGSSGIFSFSSIVGPSLSVNLARGFDNSGAPVETAVTTLTPTAVPEPSTLILAAAGMIAVFGSRASRCLRGRKIATVGR